MSQESKYSVEKADLPEGTSSKVDCRVRVKAAGIFVLCAFFFAMGRLAASGVWNPQRYFGLCGFWQKYHLPCPACFMTRAVKLFCEGDIGGSFYIQPGGALLCLGMLITAICSFLTFLGVDLRFIYCRIAKIRFRYILLILILIIAISWGMTMLRVLLER